jgi:hypothetical protein
MPPCHGGDRGFKSPRGRQIATKTPVSPVESPPYNGLKSVVLKSLASFIDEKAPKDTTLLKDINDIDN